MSLVPGFFQVPPSRMRYWSAMSTLNAPSRTMSSTMPGKMRSNSICPAVSRWCRCQPWAAPGLPSRREWRPSFSRTMTRSNDSLNTLAAAIPAMLPPMTTAVPRPRVAHAPGRARCSPDVAGSACARAAGARNSRSTGRCDEYRCCQASSGLLRPSEPGRRGRRRRHHCQHAFVKQIGDEPDRPVPTVIGTRDDEVQLQARKAPL